MRVEAALPDQPRHRELDEVLRMRIEPLLDDRDLIDDRRRGRQPAEPQAGRHHF